MILDPITLKTKTDSRGSLVVLEAERDIPFLIKRTYFIYGTKGDAPRGFHAHKTLHQAFICVQGFCTLLIDDGHTKSSRRMDNPSEAFHVGPMIWHEMHDFSSDCIFLALASDVYDERDYIRDYDDFKTQVKNG